MDTPSICPVSTLPIATSKFPLIASKKPLRSSSLAEVQESPMDGTELGQDRCDVALAVATPERSQPASRRLGFWEGVSVGLRCWHAWLFKGWYDIVLRYRSTAIGPLWLGITTGVMIGCVPQP